MYLFLGCKDRKIFDSQLDGLDEHAGSECQVLSMTERGIGFNCIKSLWIGSGNVLNEDKIDSHYLCNLK